MDNDLNARNIGKTGLLTRVLFKTLLATLVLAVAAHIPLAPRTSSVPVANYLIPEVQAADFGEICGDVIDEDGTPIGDFDEANQKVAYCQQVQAMGKSAESADWSAGIYFVAFGICALACGLQFVQGLGQAMQIMCTAANLLAGVGSAIASAVIAEEVTQALGAIQSAGSGAMQMTQMISSSGSEGGSSGGAQAMVCITAVLAGATAGLYLALGEDYRGDRDDALRAAAEYVSESEDYDRQDSSTSGGAEDNGEADTPGSALATGPAGAGGRFEDAGERFGGACPQSHGGGIDSLTACAAASGMDVPPVVTDPRGRDLLRDQTGMNADEFLANMPDDMEGISKVGGAAMAAAAGFDASVGDAFAAATYNTAHNPRFKEALGLDGLVGGGGYSGGGGFGGGGGGGGGGMDLQGMMSGMMNQFGPKGKKKKKGPADTIDFYLKTAKPEEIVRNRSIGLFDRVSYRYRRSRKEVEKLPWATRYNRSVAGQRGRSAPRRRRGR